MLVAPVSNVPGRPAHPLASRRGPVEQSRPRLRSTLWAFTVLSVWLGAEGGGGRGRGWGLALIWDKICPLLALAWVRWLPRLRAPARRCLARGCASAPSRKFSLLGLALCGWWEWWRILLWPEHSLEDVVQQLEQEQQLQSRVRGAESHTKGKQKHRILMAWTVGPLAALQGQSVRLWLLWCAKAQSGTTSRVHLHLSHHATPTTAAWKILISVQGQVPDASAYLIGCRSRMIYSTPTLRMRSVSTR